VNNFNQAKKQLLAQYPKAEILGNPTKPRRGAFEVTFNGTLIFSKFTSGRFPTKEELIENAKVLATTGKAPELPPSSSWSCILF